MEIIYTMKSKFTLGEFKRFVWSMMFKNKSTIIKLALFEVALLAIGIVIDNKIFIGFAVAYPFALWFIQNRQINKIYKSNALMKDAEVEYTFFEPCFSSNDPSGKSRVDYEKLHKIVETKTNMYLMISENQGFMLKKSEMPNGLEAFLRGKAEMVNAKGKK